MAPRRRPSKPRTSRMDAAIDAMKPYGFTEETVIAKMCELLKEYEGQYGFIELDAYSVLLESLISDQEIGHHHRQNQPEVGSSETSNSKVIVEGKEVIKDVGAGVPTDGFIDIPVCSSTTHTVLPPFPPPPPPPVLNAVLSHSPRPENVQPRRRKPCHGWISDDGDDEGLHFITLPPSLNGQISPPAKRATPHQQTQAEVTGGRKNRPKRRSRWDLRREDM